MSNAAQSEKIPPLKERTSLLKSIANGKNIKSIIKSALRNALWLGMALLMAMAPGYFSGNNTDFFSFELGIMLLMLLSSIVFLEQIEAREGELPSPFRQSLAAALITTAVLFVLSLLRQNFAMNANVILPVMSLFIFFRAVHATDFSNLRYPRIFSSGVLLLGNDAPLKTAQNLIKISNGRYYLRGVVTYPENVDTRKSNNQEQLLEQATESGVSKIIVAFSDRRGYMPVRAIMQCRIRGITVLDVPSFYEQITRKLYIENITPGWFISAPGFRISRRRRAVKRFFDLMLSMAGLALFAVILPPLAVAIKISSPGPVFFKQLRVGLGGENFYVYKLRTMRADAEKNTGAVWAQKNDSRVTSVGRFLRNTRLDELPQLFNVLIGEMSMVGPRPERPEFTQELEKIIPFYSERHYMKPGVTGWAQVRYPYGSSVQDSLEKLRYDLYYIKNQSLWLDMEIVFRTISVVIFGRGAQ